MGNEPKTTPLLNSGNSAHTDAPFDHSTYPPRQGPNTVSPGDSREWGEQWANHSVSLPPAPKDTDSNSHSN